MTFLNTNKKSFVLLFLAVFGCFWLLNYKKTEAGNLCYNFLKACVKYGSFDACKKTYSIKNDICKSSFDEFFTSDTFLESIEDGSESDCMDAAAACGKNESLCGDTVKDACPFAPGVEDISLEDLEQEIKDEEGEKIVLSPLCAGALKKCKEQGNTSACALFGSTGRGCSEYDPDDDPNLSDECKEAITTAKENNLNADEVKKACEDSLGEEGYIVKGEDDRDNIVNDINLEELLKPEPIDCMFAKEDCLDFRSDTALYNCRKAQECCRGVGGSTGALNVCEAGLPNEEGEEDIVLSVPDSSSPDNDQGLCDDSLAQCAAEETQSNVFCDYLNDKCTSAVAVATERTCKWSENQCDADPSSGACDFVSMECSTILAKEKFNVNEVSFSFESQNEACDFIDGPPGSIRETVCRGIFPNDARWRDTVGDTKDVLPAGTEDECPPRFEDDRGFGYMKAVSVNESKNDLLEIELNYTPENPQYMSLEDTDLVDFSDDIEVTAKIDEEGVDEDFLIYEWIIQQCIDGNFEDCSRLDYDGENDDDHILFGSTRTGMGHNSVQFKVLDSGIDSDIRLGSDSVLYLKVSVIVKKFADSTMKSISDIIIPVNKNVTGIKFYEAYWDDAVNKWKPAEDTNGNYIVICDHGIYNKFVCPLYPYQVIMAEVADDAGDGRNYSWFQDEEKVGSMWMEVKEEATDGSGSFSLDKTCTFGGSGILDDDKTFCQNSSDKMFFLVGNQEGKLGSISVKVGTDQSVGRNMVSDRAYMITRPQVVLKPYGDSVTAGKIMTFPKLSTEETILYEAKLDNLLQFKIDKITPDYLTSESSYGLHDLSLYWELNGISVLSDEFTAINDELYNFSYNSDAMKPTDGAELLNIGGVDFVTAGKAGDALNLTARLEKEIPNGRSEYDAGGEITKIGAIEAINRIWGTEIPPEYTISSESSFTIRLINDSDDFTDGAEKITSIRQFLASSYYNAPKYIIFTMRLALALALVWSVLFGFSYAVKLNR